MKQFFQSFLCCVTVAFFCSNVANAQEADIQRCNTDAYMQTLLEDKTYRKAYEKRQAMVAARSQTDAAKAPCTAPVSLPMAIHFQGVDASADNQACLEQLALSQVQVLNDDYQGTNADISSWINTASASFPGIDYSESCLEFCLATSNHPTSSGLSDGDYAITYNAFTGDFNSAWSGYLNIFVQSGTGVLGYSPLGGSGDGDGVVVEAFAFGTRGFNCADAGPDNSTWAYDLGRTLTHEVGHYLNLGHIWGGGCNSDDGVADTPDSSDPHYGCPTLGVASCSSTDMHMNYMDYTDDACMYMFSAGQATRSENYVNGFLAAQLKNNVCGSVVEPTCDDGIQNGGETGIDCGGPCTAICPTCDDGIMNGDETGIDCGGSFCEACPCTANTIYVNITFDNYPEETSWELADQNSNVVASGGTYGNEADGSSISEMICVGDGCFTFTINDTYGDGICCQYGDGSYNVVDENNNLLASGNGEFGSSENATFCLDGGPTCNDGIMNGDETGVDCGGSFCEACPTECGMATGLIETNPTPTGITLQWDAQTEATSYQLAGRKAGGNWKVFPVQTNNYRTFTSGIQQNTTYQWTVKVLCDGVWTDWATPVAEFTTNGATRLGNNASTFDAFDNVENFLTSNVYPNPAQNEVTIETMSGTDSPLQVRLLDLTGKLLMEKTIDANGLQTRTSLDISNFQNGYYLIEVSNGLETSISKLSVIR
ncbi:MAG: T9SS type A sorting domain-containing protein [Chitinophagales bacterium]